MMQHETSPGPSSTPPPDWFAPYGEGYCPACRFIVPRQPGGALEPHRRGTVVATAPGAGKWCPGGGKAPKQARAPFFSRLSRFTLRGEQAECPSCRQTVPVYQASQQRYRYCYRRHAAGTFRIQCASSFEWVPDGVRITRR